MATDELLEGQTFVTIGPDGFTTTGQFGGEYDEGSDSYSGRLDLNGSYRVQAIGGTLLGPAGFGITEPELAGTNWLPKGFFVFDENKPFTEQHGHPVLLAGQLTVAKLARLHDWFVYAATGTDPHPPAGQDSSTGNAPPQGLPPTVPTVPPPAPSRVKKHRHGA